MSLERLTDVIGTETDASWIRDVRRRYLAWEKVDTLATTTEAVDPAGTTGAVAPGFASLAISRSDAVAWTVAWHETYAI